MEIPKEVREIWRWAADKWPNDVARAVREAKKKQRELPQFAGLVDDLVHQATAEGIYDIRHERNVVIGRACGKYDQPSKVAPGDSEAVQAVMQSIYSLRIAGTTLGVVRGEQLNGIAEAEEARGRGHYINAALCRALVPLVPEESTVQEAVPKCDLVKIYQKACQSMHGGGEQDAPDSAHAPHRRRRRKEKEPVAA